MKKLVLILIVLAVLLPASEAHGTVLIHKPPRVINCRGTAVFALWYQQFSGGPRKIKVEVWNSFVPLAFKTFRARNNWTYHYFKDNGGNCGQTIKMIFRYNGEKWVYKIRVRRHR